MRARSTSKWASLWLAVAIAGCSSVTEVPLEVLAGTVERDGIAFTDPAIPDQVVERLAPYRVLVLGETHHLREHYAFVARLLGALHAYGFRQLLVEWPQMADWILEDYVSGGLLEPNWVPPLSLGAPLFAAIRDFNDTLPADERLHVHAIDVNLDEYGGAQAFRNLLGALATHLPTPGALTAFLQADYSTPATQQNAVQALLASLETDQSMLRPSWGSDWYDTIVQMVEVELQSVAIRALRSAWYDVTARFREDAMKQLADARIAGYGHGTVINVGGNHAQKAHLKGTKQEWLGDYLVHHSAATAGSVFIVSVVAARIELESGGAGTPYDVRTTSPGNELFRAMVDVWPGQTVFLPLDDPVFTGGGVVVNYEDTIYVCALKEQYDAVLQYALAHRVPLDS
jgi:hypothetical protein